MKRIAVIVMSCAVSCALAAGAWGEAPPKFRTDWAATVKAAKAADKPIFIHFMVDWSAEDHQMQKRVLASEPVQKALADFVPVSLNCTVRPRVEPTPAVKAAVERFKACGGDNHPFFAVTTPEGDFLYAIRGFISPEDMIAHLEKAKAARTEYNDFLAYAAKADKDTNGYKIRLLKFYIKFRKFPEVAALSEALLQADPDGAKGLAGEAKLASIAITPPGEGPNATQALYDEIKQLDPKNDKGLWERAVIAQGERHYLNALRSGDEIEFRGKLVKPTKMVEDFFENAAKIDDRRSVSQMALFLYTSQKNFEKASAVVDELMKTATDDEKPAVQRLRLGLLIQQGQFAQARRLIEELLPSATPEEKASLERQDRDLRLRIMIQEDAMP